MTLPLLAPFVPVLKVLALGSVKFIVLGIGAGFIPVRTANFLVGMSASTPLKYAEFRFAKGYLSEREIEEIRAVFDSLTESVLNPERFLSKRDAREFLISVLAETLNNMKDSVLALPSQIAMVSQSVGRDISTWINSVKKGLFR